MSTRTAFLLLLIPGLAGLLYAPLTVLRALTLPALMGLVLSTRWRHRLLHLLPFWLLLTLPVLYGHRNLIAPERVLLRSFLSMAWVALLTLREGSSIPEVLADLLPPRLQLALRITLRQHTRLRERLLWGIRAYRLWGGPSVHPHYGALLGRLLLRLEARTVQMGRALRLRPEQDHD